MTSISDEKKRKKNPNKQKQQNEQWHDAVTGGGPDTLLGYTNVWRWSAAFSKNLHTSNPLYIIWWFHSHWFQTYDSHSEQCCDNVTVSRVEGRSLCCGTRVYDGRRELCCDGVISSMTGYQPDCCGNQVYDMASLICCQVRVCCWSVVWIHVWSIARLTYYQLRVHFRSATRDRYTVDRLLVTGGLSIYLHLPVKSAESICWQVEVHAWQLSGRGTRPICWQVGVHIWSTVR